MPNTSFVHKSRELTSHHQPSTQMTSTVFLDTSTYQIHRTSSTYIFTYTYIPRRTRTRKVRRGVYRFKGRIERQQARRNRTIASCMSFPSCPSDLHEVSLLRDAKANATSAGAFPPTRAGCRLQKAPRRLAGGTRARSRAADRTRLLCCPARRHAQCAPDQAFTVFITRICRRSPSCRISFRRVLLVSPPWNFSSRRARSDSVHAFTFISSVQLASGSIDRVRLEQGRPTGWVVGLETVG